MSCPIKVSVIIPVWNPGEGISRCVASLRGQTLADIEMIFVDDCGTDGAMDVVRAAAAEDPRIRIVTNAENVGPGISRNAAIDVARGEYLSFVDADDYVDDGFLEMLYKKGKAEDLDIVKGSIVYERGDGKVIEQTYNFNERIQKGRSNGEPLFFLFHNEFQSALYHFRLFANPQVRFGVTSHGEDGYFLLTVCSQSKSFGIESWATYHLVYRESSATNTITKESLDNRVAALKNRVEYLKSIADSQPFAEQYIIKRLKYYLSLQQYVSKERAEEASRFLSDLRSVASGCSGIHCLRNEDLAILALIDYGVSLPEWPYMNQWKLSTPDDYADIIVRRAEFLMKHPKYCRFLPKLIAKANWFAWKMEAEGMPSEEIEAYRQKVNALWWKPRILWMRVKLRLLK